MGSYGFWEFYETFGGMPDRDEYVPDVREQADLERKRIREEQADGEAAERGQRPHYDNDGHAIHDA